MSVALHISMSHFTECRLHLTCSEPLNLPPGVWSGTTNRVRFSLAMKGFLSGPEGWMKLGRSILPIADYDDKQLPTKTNRPEFFSKFNTEKK